jgi:calcineurin-like phosphoesterase family protein
MNTFFTADPHFQHANIIKYCGRPFKDINEHDEMLIVNWNSVIMPDDLIYIVGDFGFGDEGAKRSSRRNIRLML